MRRLFLAPLVGLASLLASLPPASAVTSIVTDPVGFTTSTLLGSSDTYVSTPFTRPPEFVGAISATTANTITVPGAPWTASPAQFVYGGAQHNHYYLLIGPSATKEGHIYAITGNTANTLTVATTAQNDVSGIPANTQITIIPNWTPATIFPATDANVSFTPTASPPSYKTLLRVPDYSASGTNLGYAAEYYFSSNMWQRVSPAGDGSDDPLLPDGYFVVRNDNGAPTLPVTNIGAVLLKKSAAPLMTATNHAQDNPFGILRPLDIPLDATGLGPADGSFVANDQLLVFNNAQAALNKSPVIYYYDTSVGNSGGWRLTGDITPSTDHGADIIPMGAGFIVRKAQTGSGPIVWTNSFPVRALTAVSRKVHGTGGGAQTFDLPLPLNQQFFSLPGIESRVAGLTPAGAGVDHQIVLTFPTAVAFSNVIPTSGGAAVDSFSGNNSTTVTINLKNVNNTQKTTVTLLGVNDGTSANDVAVQMGVLLADVNGSGRVDGTDVSLIRQQNFQTLTMSNYLDDINGSGRIDGTDVSLARQQNFAVLH